ncbi:MAG: hypothetical protein HQL59_10345 [Magnetococcales bacterium]|nr:hypothetical protein [Magnetococcales bacterium]
MVGVAMFEDRLLRWLFFLCVGVFVLVFYLPLLIFNFYIFYGSLMVPDWYAISSFGSVKNDLLTLLAMKSEDEKEIGSDRCCNYKNDYNQYYYMVSGIVQISEERHKEHKTIMDRAGVLYYGSLDDRDRNIIFVIDRVFSDEDMGYFYSADPLKSCAGKIVGLKHEINSSSPKARMPVCLCKPLEPNWYFYHCCNRYDGATCKWPEYWPVHNDK